MTARFFVDENDLALGRALAQQHDGVMFPGHPELCEVPRGSLDDDWLPVIGAQQLIVITRDQRIRYRPVEKAMWVAHLVRGFVLTGRKSQSTAESLTILDRHWPRILDIAAVRPEGPWMYAVTGGVLRPIELN